MAIEFEALDNVFYMVSQKTIEQKAEDATTKITWPQKKESRRKDGGSPNENTTVQYLVAASFHSQVSAALTQTRNEVTKSMNVILRFKQTNLQG